MIWQKLRRKKPVNIIYGFTALEAKIEVAELRCKIQGMLNEYQRQGCPKELGDEIDKEIEKFKLIEIKYFGVINV